MEALGAALFGAVATAVLAKLRTLIDEKLSDTDMEPDATSIINELTCIEGLMADFYRSRHGQVSNLGTSYITTLRLLAYDIEDSIDFFEAKKTTLREFGKQIARFEEKSRQTREWIQIIMGQIAQVITGTSTWAADAPPQIQNLLNQQDKDHQNWIACNMNCLLYLSLFPPDHHVRTKPLIRRWLAEGLVLEEKFAVENWTKLTGSSIMQTMSIQTSNNGNVKRCRPTNEVLEYFSKRSMSENFILVYDGVAELNAAAIRRLSVHPSAEGNLILPKNLPFLRTLAVFPSAQANYGTVLKFNRYKVLRVLDLKECAELSADHLTDLWKQVLMKYLSINLGSIGKITRQIGYLEQLETLDLNGTEVVTVFKEVLLLPKLKHLFGKFQLSKRDTLFLGCAFNLRKFLEKDSVLETLAGFVTGQRIGFPQLMSRMMKLRKVKIWCKSNASQRNLGVISRAITEFIRNGNLERHLDRSLSIDFVGCSGEFLSTVHSDACSGPLKSLKLRGKLSQFPGFVKQLRSIKELCLWSTELSWQEILDGLSMLGTLKYLKLIEDGLGRIEIESGHLKSVERICVVATTSLELTIQANALLELVSLHILCKNFIVIPGTPGLQITHMHNLTEIGLHSEVQDVTKTEWEDAANSLPKRPVVLLIADP